MRGGILTAWDPATQKERWYALGGGQTGGGALTTGIEPRDSDHAATDD